MSVPYTFANATSALPLSQLDANFATPVTIGSVPVQLGDTLSSISDVNVSGSTVIATGATTARTLAAYAASTLHVRDFGAVGNGVTDDTAAIQAAINAVAALGGGTVDMSGGKWLVNSASISIKSGVCLKGPWKSPGEIASRNYLDFNSSIILNSAYTLNLSEDFAAIAGLIIVRAGITVPTNISEATAAVASFAGTAITVGDGTSAKANDTYVGYCLIIGFEYAYYNDYNERPRIEYVFGDNTNGLYLNRIYDMDYIFSCHFWPFTTAHQPWTFSGDAGWRRQGVGIYFGTGVDWGQALNCFNYGYDTGYEVNGSSNVVLLNCGADGYKDNNTYSIGFDIKGNSQNVNLIGCKAAAKFTSVSIDVGSASGGAGSVKVTGGNLWACSTGTGQHVYVKSGAAIISGGVSMFDGPIGIKTDNTAGTVTVIGNIFQTIATPFSLSNLNTVIIQNNTFVSSTDSVAGQNMLFDGNLPNSRMTYYANNNSSSNVRFRKSRGTAASPAIVQASDAIGGVYFEGYDGSAWQNAALIRTQVDGAPSSGSMPGVLIWSTSDGSTIVDRLALNSAGNFYPLVDTSYTCGTATRRWSNTYSTQFRPGSGAPIWTSGAGSPESVVTAVVGSLYTRTDGGANTTLYIKESGAGNTGWVAK